MPPHVTTADCLMSSSMYKVHHLLVCQQPPNANTVMSPHNLDTALAMLYYGAGGNSAVQMKELYFGQKKPEEVVKGLHLELVTTGQSHSKEEEGFPVIRGGCRMFLEKSLSFQEYAALLLKDFRSPAESADFRAAPDEERRRINKWVEEQTNAKITDLLPGGAITNMTSLVLVSALHYKADWKKQFMHITDNGVFHALSGGTYGGSPSVVVKQTCVRFMELRVKCNKLFSFGYYDLTTVGVVVGPPIEPNNRKLSGLGCRVIEIPYKGGDVSMVIVMPDDPLQLPVYENKWAEEDTNNNEVEQWIGNMRSSKTSMEQQQLMLGGESVIRLPYFKIMSTAEDNISSDGAVETVSMDVSKILKSLGVIDIFDRQTCDLSNITDNNNKNNRHSENLFVSGIFHKCSVEVDEKGTEASAATGAVMELTSLPSCVVNVIVDRPFIFQIRKRVVVGGEENKTSDLVLFMGRVADIKALQ
eukprot:GHVS01005647.1.p1 GENE.GHVS01005647.1~~GHVS01005647.1.p1  ORF type:complete len:473 (-),score=90.45 GHVS01005647.1:73-1491(-)